MIAKINIAFKILLCISMLVLLDVTKCYCYNFRGGSVAEGIQHNSLVITLFCGEDNWTYELIYNAFSKSLICAMLLFLANVILDIVRAIRTIKRDNRG